MASFRFPEQGLSILSRLELSELAAVNKKEYVAKAVSLASEQQYLAEMRSSLRQRMADSVLCDSKRLALEVEQAYRKMWYRWLESS
ncbi:MAG: hypothetical protein FVQ80_05685 [Planctomycetes bacterium]|nr:hypothetical protein [Planctomycetota bacterium]